MSNEDWPHMWMLSVEDPSPFFSFHIVLLLLLLILLLLLL